MMGIGEWDERQKKEQHEYLVKKKKEGKRRKFSDIYI